MLEANCLQEPNPAYDVDLNLKRDAAQAHDARVPPNPVSEGMPEPGEPPPAAGLDASPGVPSDGSVIAPGDTPTAEASPADTNPSAAPDVPLETQLKVSKTSYGVGEAISVMYSNGPGLKADWIGIYDEAAAPPSDASRSLLWYYSDNTGWGAAQPGPGPKNGTVIFTNGSKGSRQWPLPSGNYKAIFQSSPYSQLAAPANFHVR